MNNGYLPTTSLDLESLRTSLQTFLSQQDQFKDWNFAGSNLSVLVDLLTVNSHLQALYLNFVASEMFIDSAQLRESIVSHAKEIGYCPNSVTSATVNLDLQLVGNNLPGELTVPPQFSIRGQASDGTALTFMTDSETVFRSSNNWSVANVTFYEGRIITENFAANSENLNFFPLSSANVDTTSIQVQVQNSSTDTTQSPWYMASGPMSSIGSNSNVWFLQGYQDYYYQLKFGDGAIGKALAPGNIVNVNYRESSGAGGAGISDFTVISGTGVQGTNVVITSDANSVVSSGGMPAESNSSIVINAPLYAQTKGIAVTAADYKRLVKKQFPQFTDVEAYGGEDSASQKQFGTVIVSGKIQGSNIIPDPLVQSIKQFLTPLMPLGISLSVVQPVVFDVYPIVSVNYSPTALTISTTQLINNVSAQVDSFSNDNLNKFNAPLWNTPLATSLAEVDTSILSADIEYQIGLQLSNATSLNFSFGNPIKAGTIVSLPSAVSDDSNGNLLIDKLNVGSVNYSTGSVVLNLPASYSDIELIGTISQQNVQCPRGSILTIDPNNSTISLIPYSG